MILLHGVNSFFTRQQVCLIRVEDAQIAPIAVAYGLMVATKNTFDFIGIPQLEVVDLWTVKAN